jgi:superfamily II DNA or RNA helicase
LPVIVDSRLRLPRSAPDKLVRELKASHAHANPDFHRNRSMGFSTWGTPSKILTWREEDGVLTLPRGGMARLRASAEEHGLALRFIDKRTKLPREEWPDLQVSLRSYQAGAVQACIEREQGIVRAPTGSGKTIAALGLAATVAQPTLVIMRDGNLLDQWRTNAIEKLGMSAREIGVLKGGKTLKVGPRLTLSLQQTLYSGRFPIGEVAPMFGQVIIDEVHLVAAATFQKVLDQFPAKYRIGFSADETRKDGKEFLVYDQLGDVIFEVERSDLENAGVVLPVEVRMIPSTFRADWYRDASSGERDFNRLLGEMMDDEYREAELVALIRSVLRDGDTPCFVFCHRVEHARRLADETLFGLGVKAGLMLGGDDQRRRFEEDKRRLLAGEIPVATGTFQAIGTGIDVPNVVAGVIATPFGNNRQFFGQVRGRVCRAAKGKKHAVLYVLWDRDVFPRMASSIAKWNGGRTLIREDDGGWSVVK